LSDAKDSKDEFGVAIDGELRLSLLVLEKRASGQIITSTSIPDVVSASARPLLVFFALAFVISWSVWFVMRAAAIQPTLGPNFSTSPGYLLLAFGIAGPTWAALLVTSLALGQEARRDLVRRFLRWRVSWRWYLVALGMPLFLALMAALLYALAGGSGFVVESWPLIGLVPQFLWTIVLGGPLEEELGWRGFAFPRMQAGTNALESSLVIGVVWGLWHTPLFLLPGTSQYELVTQQPLAIAILWFVWFVVETTALSVFSGWLMTRTGGSVPIAMVLHAAANTSFSLLVILRVYAAWQVTLLYTGLLVLTSALVAMTQGLR
jgi:membrane protease YdiL (CAAX protease family)